MPEFLRNNSLCTIKAPCKINLHLGVGEKRFDGYHELESLFVSLDFCDFLRFEETGMEGDCLLSLEWELPQKECWNLPMEENMVYKAVSLFREETGFNSGLRIGLVKRIPAGAGLGGGSSDAASTLLALNFIAKTALQKEKLEEMALKLGSDVPFFLGGGAAFVSGRGERIEPVKPPKGFWVVLSKPPIFSDTAFAFRLMDSMREAGREKSSHLKPSRKTLIQALEKDPVAWPFYNDFLPVFLEQKEYGQTYRLILKSLKSEGASFVGMSGSGSCCFGVFKNEKTAKKSEKSQIVRGNFARSTFFLAHKPNPVVEY